MTDTSTAAAQALLKLLGQPEILERCVSALRMRSCPQSLMA